MTLSNAGLVKIVTDALEKYITLSYGVLATLDLMQAETPFVIYSDKMTGRIS